MSEHANDGYEPSGAGTVIPPNIMPGALREQLAAERGGDVAAAGAGATPAGHSGETGNALDADLSAASGGEDLTGDELDARAAELDIRGRSSMTADEKRAAIAEAEAAQA